MVNESLAFLAFSPLSFSPCLPPAARVPGSVVRALARPRVGADLLVEGGGLGVRDRVQLLMEVKAEIPVDLGGGRDVSGSGQSLHHGALSTVAQRIRQDEAAEVAH